MRIPKDVFNSAVSTVEYSDRATKDNYLRVFRARLENSRFFGLIILQKQLVFKDMLQQEVGFTNYPLDISLYFNTAIADPSLQHANGYYDHTTKTIVINSALFLKHNCKESGTDIYAVLRHELHHAIQHYMVDHIEEFADRRDNISLYSLIFTGQNCSATFCQTKPVNIDLLFNKIVEDNSLSVMFYALNITEREAHRIQYELYQPNTNLLEESYSFARRRYGRNLQDKEIDQLIDQSFRNIYHHKNPNGSYEWRNQLASMMYDLLYAGKAMHDNNYSLMADGNLLLHKKRVLAEHGYNMPGEEPINDLMFDSDTQYDVSFVRNLSVERQRVNPKYLMLCLRRHICTANDIKDQEAFIYEALKFVNEENTFAYEAFYQAFPEYSTKYSEEEREL